MFFSMFNIHHSPSYFMFLLLFFVTVRHLEILRIGAVKIAINIINITQQDVQLYHDLLYFHAYCIFG